MTASRALQIACLVVAGSLAGNLASRAADPVLTAAAVAPSRLSHGRFRDVLVYRPAKMPASFVLFLSGDEGWTAVAETMARELVQQGTLVTAIDWPKFRSELEADADQCVSPDGDLENLSHFVQAYYHTPTYQSPILVGISSGAAMSYAMLAQAPRNTFAAALTLNFCPGLDLEKPLCKGSGLEFVRSGYVALLRGRGVNLLPNKSLANPWLNLQSEHYAACPMAAARDFVSGIRGAAIMALPGVGLDVYSLPKWLPQYNAGYKRLAAQNARRVAPPTGLSDLPLVEVPATPNAVGPGSASNAFAIIMSGDGGWAGLDQDVAAALSATGIPVVGLDSLRYYWAARTPDGVASDTDRIIRYYLAHFGKQRVLLIGYSQGADVLPFAVNRLPEATRARVALTAVMGMSDHALFEFHLSSWISDDKSGPATLPEINRVSGMPVLCIYGEDEKDSLCPKLDPKRFDVVKLKGGHHFDGDYANLARQILAAANP